MSAVYVKIAPAVVCARAVVTDVERLGTNFVRLTLAGQDFGRWSEFMTTPGPVADAYVKLIVPPAGRDYDELASVDAEDLRGWFALPAEERGWLRTYTVRRARRDIVDGREVPAMDIDVLTHPDDDEGPGASWARRAVVGDRLCVLGPGGGHDRWTGFAPGSASRVLCAGDASAAPALCSIAEMLDRGRLEAADVLVEVSDAGDRDALAADVELRPGATGVAPEFLLRADGCVGGRLGSGRLGGGGRNSRHGTALIRRFADELGVGGAAVNEVLAGRRPTERQWHFADDVRADAPYLLLAGEAGMVQALRRLCIDAAGIPKGNVAFMGYWRTGARESD